MQRRAPAKINLSLHITGRRADGYHLLDSVVAFAADAFDRVEAEAAPTLHLAVDGGVPIQDNLVAQAAALLQKDSGISKGAALHLTKRLPVSGGIGGGSADAAATLHLLNELWQLRYPVEKLASLGEKIGADVPVCVHGKACRMQGIGEKITPITLPELHAVLVNPGVAVETRAVFAAGISAGEAIPPMEKTLSAGLPPSAMTSRLLLLSLRLSSGRRSRHLSTRAPCSPACQGAAPPASAYSIVKRMQRKRRKK